MKTDAFLIFSLLLASPALAQSSADSFDLTGLSPDDQTSLGKFTTAGEVGMILEMTKATGP